MIKNIISLSYTECFSHKRQEHSLLPFLEHQCRLERIKKYPLFSVKTSQYHPRGSDGNSDLQKSMKSAGNGKYVSKYKRLLFFSSFNVLKKTTDV